MLGGLLTDWGIAAGGALADCSSTAYCVRRHGIEGELNPQAYNGVEKYGEWAYFSYQAVGQSIGLFGKGILLYGLDTLISQIPPLSGWRESTFKLHHAFLYGMGFVKYATAASNMMEANGWKRTASVLRAPGLFYFQHIMPRLRWKRRFVEPIKQSSLPSNYDRALLP